MLSETENGAELTPQPDKKIKIVDVIRGQLQANPNVFFAGETHHYRANGPESGHPIERVHMIISPIIPEFDAKKLNSFRDSLITGIVTGAEVSGEIPFSSGDDALFDSRFLWLPTAAFYEEIGLIRKTITTTINTDTIEPETFAKAGEIVGKSQSRSIWRSSVRREILLKIYPDCNSAQFAYESENINGMDARLYLEKSKIRELKSYYPQHSLVSRIRNILPF
ncbi:MAG: hypothetical protein Q7R97_05155 [Candidatus Daviesbacteria bacterium]|nr:hypothetical protein [Candidatus Daviesbacteria bacterium]